MKIMVGADPEFELRSITDAGIDASDHIRDGYLDRKLGLDGRADTGELRPDPGEPITVVEDISRLLSDLTKYIPADECFVYAGSGKTVPLGGHIHFSGITWSSDLLERLYRFLIVPLNSRSDTSLRTAHGYGTSHDEVRKNNHGWEYRRPLSWIVSPKIALGVLSVAMALAVAKQQGHIGEIDSIDSLIERSQFYAKEIREFYDELKASKPLESIEIQLTWGIRPGFIPMFRESHIGLSSIAQLVDCSIHLPYPTYINGLSSTRTMEEQIWISPYLAKEVRNNGAFRPWMRVWRDCPNPYSIGIGVALRTNNERHKLAANRIRHIFKAIRGKG